MSAKFVGVIRPAVDRLVQARRRLRPLDPDGPAASEREQPNQTHGGDGGGPTRHRRLSRTLCVAEDGPDGDLLSWVAVGSGGLAAERSRPATFSTLGGDSRRAGARSERSRNSRAQGSARGG